jgi:hypothetical protein
MVMVGVGSGSMGALCNLEKEESIATATRAKLALEQLAGMKGVVDDRELCPSQALPPGRK